MISFDPVTSPADRALSDPPGADPPPATYTPPGAVVNERFVVVATLELICHKWGPDVFPEPGPGESLRDAFERRWAEMEPDLARLYTRLAALQRTRGE